MGFLADLVRRVLGAAPRAPEPAKPIPAAPKPAPAAPAARPSTPAGPPPAPTPIIDAPRTLGLDAGDFLPASPAELAQQAQAGGPDFRFNVWFGRTDRIPPTTDPRTLLIDRGMIGQGLLTPEQLREIHEVGARMERVREASEAAEARAGRSGDEAVAADRAERARIKAAKKAEVAERRRLHAEKVAHRHATDIVYLGRGVSGRLNDRTSDLAALEARGMPALQTPADLAEALGLPVPRLRWLAFHAEAATRVHYVGFAVPKRSGGTRSLLAPHTTLALAQRWILERIVARMPVEAEAHGFAPGRSILSNALPHAGKAVVANLDLEAFFPSIGFPRVRSVFQRAGYSPAVATILALLCTECPRRTVTYDGTTYHVATGPRGLPQGACTSPGLSNQVARRLDHRLAGLSAKLGATYTRYADDLTFSGGPDLDPRVGYLLARVRHLASAEGFRVNEAKTRVLRRNAAQTVTGLVVNDRPGVPRDEVRRLRAILHRARTEGLAAQNRDGHPDFRAYLLGKIAFVGMARPEAGAKLRAEFDSLPAD
ncbi:reverse transcriptase family protein [Tundrisphaera sp. TA3]|uniref:reverse transcriptase family protein n=1 Tax=Tundrisphaera sp. TA3 TaxID=3435775 RepID=UPI003EBB065B